MVLRYVLYLFSIITYYAYSFNIQSIPLRSNYYNKMTNNIIKMSSSNSHNMYCKIPIPIITFDTLVMNIKNINHVIISHNADRIIVIYGHGNRGVFYIDDSFLEKVVCILNYTNSTHTLEYSQKMDDPANLLYCMPQSKNSTFNEI